MHIWLLPLPLHTEVKKGQYFWTQFVFNNKIKTTYGVFTIYVYNARWVGGQKSGKFVNVYSIKIVNEGRWVVKNK